MIVAAIDDTLLKTSRETRYPPKIKQKNEKKKKKKKKKREREKKKLKREGSLPTFSRFDKHACDKLMPRLEHVKRMKGSVWENTKKKKKKKKKEEEGKKYRCSCTHLLSPQV